MRQNGRKGLHVTQNRIFSPNELAAIGEGQVAYVRPVSSDEVPSLFPQAPKLAPGVQLFALLSASGTPIMLTDSREAAMATAWENNLATLSVH